MTETRPNPRRGETWRHCKGTLYEIDRITRETEGERPHRVVYFDPSASEPEYHDRPLAMFMNRHSSGAWRFERVGALEQEEEKRHLLELAEANAVKTSNLAVEGRKALERMRARYKEERDRLQANLDAGVSPLLEEPWRERIAHIDKLLAGEA